MFDQRAIPLYAFLACFSRNYSHDCFKPLDQISHSYSAIIKYYQFLILYWLHTDIFVDPKPDQSMVGHIRSWMHSYFTGQSEAPLGHVLVLRGLAFAVMKSATSLGQITLVAPHTLKCRHVTLSQQALQVFLAKVLGQLSLTLSNELFFSFSNFAQVSLNIYLMIAVDIY